jgi:hypothetical protein
MTFTDTFKTSSYIQVLTYLLVLMSDLLRVLGLHSGQKLALCSVSMMAYGASLNG